MELRGLCCAVLFCIVPAIYYVPSHVPIQPIELSSTIIPSASLIRHAQESVPGLIASFLPSLALALGQMADVTR